MFRPNVFIQFFFLPFFLCFCSSVYAEIEDSSFRVQKIEIIGNKKTKDRIILRELSFRVGDSLNSWNYHREQSRKQLINLFLFNEIEIKRLGNTIYIYVTERWYFWPIPEIDYADRNFNQWWLSKDPKRLIYGVNLEWYNIRGRNETMVLSLITGYTKMASINYKIPYFNKKQTWGLQLNALYNSNKEVWYKTELDKVQFFKDNDRNLIFRKNAEISFTHRKKIFTYHNLYAGYKETKVEDTVVSYEVNRRFLLEHLNKQKELYLGYQFIYDKRDFKGYPLKGHLLKLNAEFSNFLIPKENLQTATLKLAYSRYFPLSTNFYGAFHVGARYYSNPAPPYSKVQALGYGKDYIRGYELNVIDGSHFGLGKTELKYRFFNKKISFMPGVKNYEVLPVTCYLTSFYDFGYVENKYEKNRLYSQNRLPNSFQNGGGAGLNIVLFYDYVMRIEYSINRYLKSRTYLSFVASM